MSEVPEPSSSSNNIPNNTEEETSFIYTMAQNLGQKKAFFPADQEIFVDSSFPLILLNDTNTNLPVRNFYIRPRSGRKDATAAISGDSESSRRLDSPDSKGRDSRSGKGRSHHRERRASLAVSNGGSYLPSETFKGDGDSESRSPSKSRIEDEAPEEDVDVFGGAEEKVQKVENPLKKKLRVILDTKWFNVMMAITTLYALFAQDLCGAVFGNGAELIFDIISLVTIIIYIIEFAMLLYTDKHYFNSFFFWLDIISTISIFLDVNFISNPIFLTAYTDDSVISQQSIAATIGQRFGSVMRVVRLVRLVKLYKQIVNDRFKKKDKDHEEGHHEHHHHHHHHVHDKDSKQSVDDTSSPKSPMKRRRVAPEDPEMENLRLDGGDMNRSIGKSPDMSPERRRMSKLNNSVMTITALNQEEGMVRDPTFQREGSSKLTYSNGRNRTQIMDVSQGLKELEKKKEEQRPKMESRVGKRLGELTMKRVILMTLSILLFYPFFSASFFFNTPASQSFEMLLIQQLFNNTAVTDAVRTTAVQTWIYKQNSSVANTPDLVYIGLSNGTVYIDDTTVNVDSLRILEAPTVILPTAFGSLKSVCTSRQYYQLTNMISILRTLFICFVLALGAWAFNNDNRKLILDPIEEMIQKVREISKDPLIAKKQEIREIKKKDFQNEVVYIGNAITKIGGLLALGYGNAGSAIIGKNIVASGDVNPMLPGKKIAAMYGFSDIRYFAEATEVLQEDVMMFVNSIAEVVHSLVDKYTGATNKNIGEAFLLVWKFDDDDYVTTHDGNVHLKSNQLIQNKADAAVMSFMKIYARINRDPDLLKYRENAELLAVQPGFKVKKGFGLHLGWAIEGAIGSEFKIDASYLSPNVNMASRLQYLTKHYGVPVLVSGDIYDTLSYQMQQKLRKIDIVTVKGSIKPVELYTADLDIEGITLPPEEGGLGMSKNRSSLSKVERRLRHENKKEIVANFVKTGSVFDLFDEDKELKYMYRNDNHEFNEHFAAGFRAYIDGDWGTAKKKFELCQMSKEDDGPTKALYRYIETNDFISPEDWEGYHKLTEK